MLTLLHLFSHIIHLILREKRVADECQGLWYPSVYLSEYDMLRLSVCKWCTLLNTAVLCEMHVREGSEEEEEVKTSTRTYGPHQTVLPQWGLKRQHAVGIKYSVGITLPWLKVTVGNKRREQSREKCDVSTNKRFTAVETALLFYFQFISTKFYSSFCHPVRFTLSRTTCDK